MKRTVTVITAAIFATALALPAFAQVGAGVAGNATVGSPTMHEGANRDVSNDDAERAEPAAPLGSRLPSPPPQVSKTGSDNHNSVGTNAGAGASAGDTSANAAAGDSAANSDTGGY